MAVAVSPGTRQELSDFIAGLRIYRMVSREMKNLVIPEDAHAYDIALAIERALLVGGNAFKGEVGITRGILMPFNFLFDHRSWRRLKLESQGFRYQEYVAADGGVDFITPHIIQRTNQAHEQLHMGSIHPKIWGDEGLTAQNIAGVISRCPFPSFS